MSNHILNLQRQLGFTGKDLDGKRGPKTNAAVLTAADQGRLSVAETVVLIAVSLPDDGITNLHGVHADLVGVIDEAARRSSVPFTVIEGVRTAARQKQLVAAGASKTSNSRHLTGHAADLWPLDPKTGKRLPSDAAFARGSAQAKAASDRLWADLRKISTTVKAIAQERGISITWGGDWGWDAPHFELSRAAYPA